MSLSIPSHLVFVRLFANCQIPLLLYCAEGFQRNTKAWFFYFTLYCPSGLAFLKNGLRAQQGLFKGLRRKIGHDRVFLLPRRNQWGNHVWCFLGTFLYLKLQVMGLLCEAEIISCFSVFFYVFFNSQDRRLYYLQFPWCSRSNARNEILILSPGGCLMT